MNEFILDGTVTIKGDTKDMQKKFDKFLKDNDLEFEGFLAKKNTQEKEGI